MYRTTRIPQRWTDHPCVRQANPGRPRKRDESPDAFQPPGPVGRHGRAHPAIRNVVARRLRHHDTAQAGSRIVTASPDPNPAITSSRVVCAHVDGVDSQGIKKAHMRHPTFRRFMRQRHPPALLPAHVACDKSSA
jgi:hypothetical protein